MPPNWPAEENLSGSKEHIFLQWMKDLASKAYDISPLSIGFYYTNRFSTARNVEVR